MATIKLVVRKKYARISRSVVRPESEAESEQASGINNFPEENADGISKETAVRRKQSLRFLSHQY